MSMSPAHLLAAFTNSSTAFVFFKNAVAEEFGRHNYLKDSSELSEAEKEKYKSKRKNMRNSLPMTVMKK